MASGMTSSFSMAEMDKALAQVRDSRNSTWSSITRLPIEMQQLIYSSSFDSFLEAELDYSHEVIANAIAELQAAET